MQSAVFKLDPLVVDHDAHRITASPVVRARQPESQRTDTQSPRSPLQSERVILPLHSIQQLVQGCFVIIDLTPLRAKLANNADKPTPGRLPLLCAARDALSHG